jgi:hypothetical protein
LTKMSQRFAPVKKNMHRWGFWTNSRCPACHQDNEDEDHLVKCPDQQCKDVRKEAISVLRQRLQKCKTEPLLEHSLTLFRINCSQSSQPSTSLVYSDLFLAFTNFFE